MLTVVLTHEVKDYAPWRKVYDAGEPLRKASNINMSCSLHFGGQPKQINLNWRGCQYGSHAGFYAKPATGQRYGSCRGNKQTGNYGSEENVRIA